MGGAASVVVVATGTVVEVVEVVVVALGVLEHLGEVVLQPVLRLRLPDAGAPELVGDEQQDEDAGGDARAPDRPEDLGQAHRTRG